MHVWLAKKDLQPYSKAYRPYLQVLEIKPATVRHSVQSCQRRKSIGICHQPGYWACCTVITASAKARWTLRVSEDAKHSWSFMCNQPRRRRFSYWPAWRLPSPAKFCAALQMTLHMTDVTTGYCPDPGGGYHGSRALVKVDSGRNCTYIISSCYQKRLFARCQCLQDVLCGVYLGHN